MSDQQFLTAARGGATVVTSCWMCGIHLSADHMLADGGSACADVRWYCLDTRGCTQRWTSRPARLGEVRQGSGGTSQIPGEQFTGPDVTLPARV